MITFETLITLNGILVFGHGNLVTSRCYQVITSGVGGRGYQQDGQAVTLGCTS